MTLASLGTSAQLRQAAGTDLTVAKCHSRGAGSGAQAGPRVPSQHWAEPSPLRVTVLHFFASLDIFILCCTLWILDILGLFFFEECELFLRESVSGQLV